MDKKKRTAIVSAVAALIVAIGAYWYVNYQIPHNEAVEAFNAAADGLQGRNDDLDAANKELQKLNKSKDKPYDSSVSDSATDAVAQAQAAKEDIPAMPGNTDKINTMAKKVNKMGKYDSVIADLSAAKSNLQDSIDQLKQVTNPSEQFVLQRLTGIANITTLEAVSEGNDPNNKLGKQGGYTACVYFNSDLVDSSDVYLSGDYTPVVDGGCDAGGAVEVYSNVKDAKKRNEYLSNFDGNSILDPGSHKVVGTCVVRTSYHLAASQQNNMTSNIEQALIRLDK